MDASLLITHLLDVDGVRYGNRMIPLVEAGLTIACFQWMAAVGLAMTGLFGVGGN